MIIFIILFQIRAVTIILISSSGIGATQGFSNTAAVVYVDKNLTTLPEILNDEEISWLSTIFVNCKYQNGTYF